MDMFFHSLMYKKMNRHSYGLPLLSVPGTLPAEALAKAD